MSGWARHEPEAGADADAEQRRRFRRAWLAGAVPSLLLFAWVLTVEGGSLLQRQYFDDFYDAQARSLFDGHLDVPPEVVGFEGFALDGHTYIYFGPVPALLRMPLLAVTDRFDGRLTTLSMLGAAVVLAAATYRLTWALRRTVRGAGAEVTRREQWAAAGLAVAMLTGPPLFMASAAVVYHEAALWGLALSLASYDAVVRWLRDPGARRLVVVGVLVTLALLTRQVVAFGPLAALVLGGADRLARAVRQPFGEDAVDRTAVTRRTVAGVAAACLVPLALSCAVNYAKFELLFGVPMGRQVNVGALGNRAEVMATNPNYLGVEYLPTTLLTYLRPDGVQPRADFPWIDFPREGPTRVGDATFDALDWSSSLPATAPALVVLTVGGIVWRVRTWSRHRRRARDPEDDEDDLPGDVPAPEHGVGPPDPGARTGEVVPLWPLYAGGVAGAATVLVFAYVANRYLLDLFPLAVIGGIVGFHAASRLRGRRRQLAMVGLGGLVALGTLTNLALALEFQHERGPVIPEARRARWIDWRLDLPGARSARTIGVDEPMPPVADGDLVAVGDCDGLYVGMRDQWLAVERGPGVGVHRLRVDAGVLDAGVRYPVATFGDGDQSTVVGLVRVDEDTARVDVLGPELFASEWVLGDAPIPLDDDEPLTLRLDADPRQRTPNVYRGDDVVNAALLPSYLPRGEAQPALGQAPPRPGVEQRLPGGVDRLPTDLSLCPEATGSERASQ